MLGTAGDQHHQSQCHPVVLLYLQGFLGGWAAEQQHEETEAGGGWLLALHTVHENRIRSSRSWDKSIRSWIRRLPQCRRRPRLMGSPISIALGDSGTSKTPAKGWEVVLEAFRGERG